MKATDFVSQRFRYTFGPHAPELRIASGARLRVTCPDSDNEMSDGVVLPPERRQSDVAGLFEGNPMAGPIYLEGALPNDVLAVRIEGIELDRVTGQTGLAPSHGFLPGELLLKHAPAGTSVPRHLFRWRIDVDAGVAELVNPLGDRRVAVSLNPFVGCIGVSPPWGQSISTLYSGVYGGNMDLPAVRPGATIHFPVFVEGGLLMMGDIHAAQGHGEIIGGGIETCGKIDCVVELIKRTTIPAPRIRDAERITALGFDGDLRQAIQRAYAHLLDWVSADYGLNRWDAYNLISQVGALEIGGLGFTPYAVGASIALGALPPS